MPLLSAPLALLGLALLPALAAVYMLRHKVKRLPVSALFLWRDARPLPEGGVKLQRLATPLLFFLELLALSLLVAAAAAPLTSCGGRRIPLALVLDDSYSMRAGGRERAKAALLSERGGSGRRPLSSRSPPARATAPSRSSWRGASRAF
jgi:hypothetical protein